MRNLLSPEYRQMLVYEYVTRIVIVFLFIGFGIGVINILLLGPAFWVMRVENSALSESIVSAEGTSDISLKQTKKDIETLSAEVIRIGEYSAQTGPSSYVVLSSLLSMIPEGVSLHAISLKGTKRADITVRGVAQTREALVAFVDALERSQNFEDTTLPLPKFAQREGIDFSLSLVSIQAE
jgi:Tfp pilus assembly protein PilN